MALFKRTVLKEKGLTDEQIEYLMTESNRALAANYLPKSEVQEQINHALEDAKKNVPEDVTQTEAYKTVAAERDMLRALSGDEFSSVKPKFREAVYKMLERGEEAKPIPEQLEHIAEQYEEYFTPKQTEQPARPRNLAQRWKALCRRARKAPALAIIGALAGRKENNTWLLHKNRSTTL